MIEGDDDRYSGEPVIGAVVAAVLLWIGYRIGRWRARGDRA